MRMIDAEKLERLFNEQIEQGVGVIDAFDAFYDALQDTPTVDAVEVVLCRDCIYTRKVYGRLVCKYGTCAGCILRDDFFCANGKRQGGGEDG